ncbi:MAG: 2-C-methyl-D-erythritol 2,4-cyclodiphosphate synthase [Candidatus Omnitrophica bacterium]|nr:2-C-methyl-D-erythritol 2,4-cyclodiphosphate synthase [Candidatus Omnitrophota bacterium]
MRIGIGYDIHRLVKGRKLVLGGVQIPHKKGLLGHSDADVLLHAVCDALLGAAGLPDIGKYFPNTDKRFKNISSLKLLDKTLAIIKQKKYSIQNIDTMILAQAPKISPYRNKMILNIAKTLKIKPDKINIKATTEEGTRKTEAIAAYAVALLK